MTNVIICEACRRKGTAGNLYIDNRAGTPVFRHLGHDPYTGEMHYTCLYCGAVLAVDPMEMLHNFFIKGIPINRAESVSGNLKNEAIPQSGQLLERVFREIS